MNQIWNEVMNSETIGISGHIRPDGDCVGACMSMYNYLVKRYPHKEIDIYLENILKEFTFIANTDKVKIKCQGDKVYDLFFSLDCGELERIGVAKESFLKAKKTINVDHHISNTNFADLNYVKKDASSTCELIYDLMDEKEIDVTIAESLYLGISHDTGVFKYSNTTRHTMEIAGKLIDKGFDFSKMIQESFYQKTYIQNQILGRCLLESILILDQKCIFSVITQKMMDFYGADPKDLDGIIDQLKVTKDVKVAILIHEVSSQEYKVSMRANGNIDVSKIAVFFGGGGHMKAAGCTMKGSMHDVINNLTAHIEEQLQWR